MPCAFMRDSFPPGKSRGRGSVRAATGRRRHRAGRSPASPGGRRPGAPGPDAGAGFPGRPGHARGAARSIRGGRLRPRSRRARRRLDALPGGGPPAAAASRGPGNDRPAPSAGRRGPASASWKPGHAGNGSAGVEHVADGHEQARIVETQHAAGTALVPLGLGAAAQVLAQARQRPGAEQEHQVAAAVDAFEQFVQPARVAVFQAQQQWALVGQGGLRGLLQQFEQRRRIALPRMLGKQGIVVQPGSVDQHIDVGLQAAIAGALPQLAGPMAGFGVIAVPQRSASAWPLSSPVAGTLRKPVAAAAGWPRPPRVARQGCPGRPCPAPAAS